MAAYFFASPIDVDIKLEGEDVRKQVDIKGEKDKITSCAVYYDGDSVTGQVCQCVSYYFGPLIIALGSR
jgi:vacuolar protein sorting-associated protein 26